MSACWDQAPAQHGRRNDDTRRRAASSQGNRACRRRHARLGTHRSGRCWLGPDGTYLSRTATRSVTDADITAHPELKLARWAARELDPTTVAATTMYTSCQPCAMCTGAIERSGLGRVVFALSTEQLADLKSLAVGSGRTHDYEGPNLFDEAHIPVDGYYR